MRRKIIKQAGQAYTITLPIEWVRDHGIEKKAEVEVEVVENALLITSSARSRGESVHLSANGLSERNLYVHLAALYARGVDEITVEISEDISAEINRCLQNLLGFALIDQNTGKYVIRDLGLSYPQLDDIFKRVFQMVLLFYEAAFNDIFGAQQETINSLKMRDVEINKFCLYLERAINKHSYASAINGRILFTYSFMLEKISDEIERLWRTNIKYKVVKSKAVREIIISSKETLARAFDFYYQKKRDNVDALYHIRDNVREMSIKIPRSDPNTTRFVRHIVKIAEDATDLIHLSLMHTSSEKYR